MSKDKWSCSRDSKRKWYRTACKRSVKMEKLQKSRQREDRIINRIKTTWIGRQDIFYFSRLNLIASTGCTLCAEHFYHGQPKTLGNCCCCSLAEKTALIKHLLTLIPRMYSMLQGLWKNRLKQILHLLAIQILKSSGKVSHNSLITVGLLSKLD